MDSELGHAQQEIKDPAAEFADRECSLHRRMGPGGADVGR
jgi:hypothetical protein